MRLRTREESVMKDVVQHLEEALEYIDAMEEAVGTYMEDIESFNADDYEFNYESAMQAIEDLRNKYL